MTLHDAAGLAQRVDDHIASLAKVADPDLPGWSRPVFSEPYRASRAVVEEMMHAAGLRTSRDPAGNIVGRLTGRYGGPAIVLGSHTDTVVGGGRFDGVAGVVASITVANLLRHEVELNHDLVVVDFLGEEANVFGSSCVGSRAVSGNLDSDLLAHTDHHGRSLGDAMLQFGLDPSAAQEQARWSPNAVHAFVELHIEQGPVLERLGHQIGVVTAIAGIERVLATFAGRADHAGTMPMTERMDALAAAAEAVLTVERVGCGAPVPAIATAGRLDMGPGSFNVVPDRAAIWAEIRSAEQQWLTGARRDLAKRIAADARRRGVGVDIDELIHQPPVPTSPQLQDLIAAVSADLGLPCSAIPSGAGHDAAHLAHLGPMGMIFIPSHEGRSHCPQEWTDTGDIVAGTTALAETVRLLDKTETIHG